ncbi:MAG: LysR substrate-binding domain-containing protein, partial [Pseudomonadota bacterium]
MLTIRQLQFFEALARERHFRRAAEAVNITQPALSAQIMEMEARLGTSLVERSRGGVTLTPVGKQLLPKAQAILHQMQELTEMAVHTPGPLSGTLEIGMIPTVAPYLLPKLLPSVQSAFPSLNLKVREAVTEQLVADLKAGKLTAVIAAKPIHDTSLREIELFDDPFFIAAGTNTNDVVSSPATHDSVALERLLLLEDGHCLRDQALEACNAAGNRRLVNFGATSMTTLLQLVA